MRAGKDRLVPPAAPVPHSARRLDKRTVTRIRRAAYLVEPSQGRGGDGQHAARHRFGEPHTAAAAAAAAAATAAATTTTVLGSRGKDGEGDAGPGPCDGDEAEAVEALPEHQHAQHGYEARVDREDGRHGRYAREAHCEQEAKVSAEPEREEPVDAPARREFAAAPRVDARGAHPRVQAEGEEERGTEVEERARTHARLLRRAGQLRSQNPGPGHASDHHGLYPRHAAAGRRLGRIRGGVDARATPSPPVGIPVQAAVSPLQSGRGIVNGAIYLFAAPREERVRRRRGRH